MDDLLADADVKRHCLQIDQGNGLAVPGLMIPFETTTTAGRNLFGMELSAGDSAFNPSSFATKIFAVGVALVGYRGMSDPAATTSTVGSTGALSPTEPSTTFLDPQALAATPYVYFIPVGADAMRSPPFGRRQQHSCMECPRCCYPTPVQHRCLGFFHQKYTNPPTRLPNPCLESASTRPFGRSQLHWHLARYLWNWRHFGFFAVYQQSPHWPVGLEYKMENCDPREYTAERSQGRIGPIHPDGD